MAFLAASAPPPPVSLELTPQTNPMLAVCGAREEPWPPERGPALGVGEAVGIPTPPREGLQLAVCGARHLSSPPRGAAGPGEGVGRPPIGLEATAAWRLGAGGELYAPPVAPVTVGAVPPGSAAPQPRRSLPLRGRVRPVLPEGRGAVLSAATISRRARLLLEFRSACRTCALNSC